MLRDRAIRHQGTALCRVNRPRPISRLLRLLPLREKVPEGRMRGLDIASRQDLPVPLGPDLDRGSGGYPPDPPPHPAFGHLLPPRVGEGDVAGSCRSPRLLRLTPRGRRRCCGLAPKARKPSIHTPPDLPAPSPSPLEGEGARRADEGSRCRIPARPFGPARTGLGPWSRRVFARSTPSSGLRPPSPPSRGRRGGCGMVPFLRFLRLLPKRGKEIMRNRAKCTQTIDTHSARSPVSFPFSP